MGQVSTLTIGSNTYNVYALTADPLADANAYMAAHVNASSWTSATDDRKKMALVSAARMIDRERWSGEVLVGGQSTKWPRTGATNSGDAVADGTPDDIALGEFEYALALLSDASLLNKNTTASNVSSVGAGSAQVSFFYPLPGTSTRWPLPVNDLLAGYLAGAAAGVDIISPYVGGADTSESAFTDIDADRSEGFA